MIETLEGSNTMAVSLLLRKMHLILVCWVRDMRFFKSYVVLRKTVE